MGEKTENIDVFENPRKALLESLGAMNGKGAVASEVRWYLQMPWNEKPDSADAKDPDLQRRMVDILGEMIAGGNKALAEAVFNMHRIFTEYCGYGANEEASEDVENCFGEEFDIPETGLIVVDAFVTRNLPKIVEICEARKVDLRRIRVRCPRAVFAAQLMTMGPEKKAQMEGVLAKLDKSQFLIEDVGSSHNIGLPKEGKVAVHFTPRTLPFRLEWHEEDRPASDGGTGVEYGEVLTSLHYIGWVREAVARVVPGGRIFMNIAVVPKFEPLGVDRDLVRPTQQITEYVARCIVDVLRSEGMEILDDGRFGPIAEYDHKKIIQGLHVRKPEDWVSAEERSKRELDAMYARDHGFTKGLLVAACCKAGVDYATAKVCDQLPGFSMVEGDIQNLAKGFAEKIRLGQFAFSMKEALNAGDRDAFLGVCRELFEFVPHWDVYGDPMVCFEQAYDDFVAGGKISPTVSFGCASSHVLVVTGRKGSAKVRIKGSRDEEGGFC